MPAKNSPRPAPPRDENPWTNIDEAGSDLPVDDFITTLVVRTANALRRTVTLPYVEGFGLTQAEWRMLSVVGAAGRLPFNDVVRLSTTDKSLVSRALRLLEKRGLVALHAVDGAPRKGLVCELSPVGRKLYEEAMPAARQAQAAMIRVLDDEERRVMYRALHKLRRACGDE